jgi:hypothetical protein
MDVLHPRCCGLDVHKRSISACILLREAGRVQKHQRRFGAVPRQSRKCRQTFARYNSSREPMVAPHGVSMRLGCRANQEHLLALAVQTLSREARQEKSHHRGGPYPHSHWLSLAEEPEQLRGSWRKLLRSHPLRRSQAVFGEAAPTTRAQGNSRADGSCLTHRFPQLFSRENAGLRRDAIRSQVIDALEAQKIKETGNEEDEHSRGKAD